MSRASQPDTDLDEYVYEQLREADREVLRAIVESGSPLSGRARRALEYLDAQEGDQ
ncbi:hypothetical protein [Haloarcula salina]|uniref:Uncharacterized protein n=1 Tax=Haloarcula salina TaxID=1429914 RepID=A0AA41FYK6_9EURY|nr:hypothetical protein [Haloarcula salina]MBV0900181.1 hypothetical protein [Haloarcula salina]